MGILPLPFCKLFQIHDSKFKPHPICYLGQACVSGVAHPMLLLGIREHTLYLMKVLPHDRMGMSIRPMLGTGMRSQEIMALERMLQAQRISEAFQPKFRKNYHIRHSWVVLSPEFQR